MGFLLCTCCFPPQMSRSLVSGRHSTKALQSRARAPQQPNNLNDVSDQSPLSTAGAAGTQPRDTGGILRGPFSCHDRTCFSFWVQGWLELDSDYFATFEGTTATKIPINYSPHPRDPPQKYPVFARPSMCVLGDAQPASICPPAVSTSPSRCRLGGC